MLKDSIVYSQLRKTKLLFDSIAWIQSFTPSIKTEILNYIRKDQLTNKGVDEDGDIIGFYSLATEFISNGQKKQGDHFTLDDTGAFYRSMWITVMSDGIIIDGDTVKMEDQYWWNDSILGLTDENVSKLTEKIKEKYIEFARKTLEID